MSYLAGVWSNSKRESRVLLALGLVLAASVGLSVLSHGAPLPLRKQMTDFPQTFGQWKGIDVPVDYRTQEVLGATDLLNRVYVNPHEGSVSLFVAFFSSQRKGGAVHSPKNCLPGAGWWVSKSDIITILIPGYPQPLRVNQYIIQKDLTQQLVLYWYQSQGRVIASEYSAKFYLVWDALSKNRTDGALVRIIAPIRDGNEATARLEAERFAQTTFSPLADYIPN